MNRRRVLYGGSGAPDPYEGFIYGDPNSAYVRSVYFEIITSHSYEVLIWGQMQRYKSNKSYSSAENINGTAFTSLAQIHNVYGIKYFRFHTKIETLDDCYILDKNTGEYLWKGKNVK